MNLLFVAETEAPWGESAHNMRMQYAGFMQQSSSDGYSIEGRKTAQSLATRIWQKLFGVKPEPKKRRKASSFVRQ